MILLDIVQKISIQVLESRALARLEAARTDLKANDEGAHMFSRTLAAKITSLHTDISKLEVHLDIYYLHLS